MGVVLMMGGCATGTAQRIAYDTVQNYGRLQCEKNLSADCRKQESYDDYRHSLKSLDPDPH